MSGTWGSVARGWRVFVPVVVLAAAAQALLVLPAVTPGASVGFVGVAAASFLVAVVAVWLIAAAASARPVRPGWRGLLWSAIAVVVVVLAALLSIVIVPVVLAVAIVVVSAAAGPGVRDGLRAALRHPGRGIVAFLVTVLVLYLLWIAALVFGLFLTGTIGAAVTWLVFGVAATVLLCWWAARLGRAA